MKHTWAFNYLSFKREYSRVNEHVHVEQLMHDSA